MCRCVLSSPSCFKEISKDRQFVLENGQKKKKKKITGHLKMTLKVSCELNQQTHELCRRSDFGVLFVQWEKYMNNLLNSNRNRKSEEAKEAEMNFPQII